MSQQNVERADARCHQAAESILRQQGAVALALVELEFARQPELAQRFGPAGKEKSLRDARYHIAYLAEAVRWDSRALFSDYVAWARVLLDKRGVGVREFSAHLRCLRDVLEVKLPAVARAPVLRVVDHGLCALRRGPADVPSLIELDSRHAPLAGQYLDALLRGDRAAASRMVLAAVREGAPLDQLYRDVLQCAQYEVGRLWQRNQISVAQEHDCTAATQLIMSQLNPALFCADKHGGRFVGLCVAGDLHEIGARMISDAFEMAGWHTYYLGSNVPTADVVRALVAQRADVVGISATITYHLPAVDELVRLVRACRECQHVKVLLGGYPFNIEPTLARRLGADGHARDVRGALELAERLANSGSSSR